MFFSDREVFLEFVHPMNDGFPSRLDDVLFPSFQPKLPAVLDLLPYYPKNRNSLRVRKRAKKWPPASQHRQVAKLIEIRMATSGKKRV